MNHPYLDPSFLVSWSRLTPEAIRPDITEAISRAKENIRRNSRNLLSILMNAAADPASGACGPNIFIAAEKEPATFRARLHAPFLSPQAYFSR